MEWTATRRSGGPRHRRAAPVFRENPPSGEEDDEGEDPDIVTVHAVSELRDGRLRTSANESPRTKQKPEAGIDQSDKDTVGPSQIERLVSLKKRRREEWEARDSSRRGSEMDRETEDFRIDLESCAEAVSDSTYAERPIDGFGRFMLKKMGWTEDRAVVAPFMAPGRDHRMGLGADPDALRKQGLDKARERSPSDTPPEEPIVDSSRHASGVQP